MQPPLLGSAAESALMLLVGRPGATPKSPRLTTQGHPKPGATCLGLLSEASRCLCAGDAGARGDPVAACCLGPVEAGVRELDDRGRRLPRTGSDTRTHGHLDRVRADGDRLGGGLRPDALGDGERAVPRGGVRCQCVCNKASGAHADPVVRHAEVRSGGSGVRTGLHLMSPTAPTGAQWM